MTNLRSTRGGSVAMPDDVYKNQWIDRLLRKHRTVDANGCWVYGGAQSKTGYGDIAYRGKNYRPHRLIYRLLHGVNLGRWEFVCHRCDNRLCFRPSHLFLGTPKDNIVDSVLKGRHPEVKVTHCPRGHEYSQDNTSYGTNGARKCKTCVRAKCRRYHGWPEHLLFAEVVVRPGYKMDRATGDVVAIRRKAA